MNGEDLVAGPLRRYAEVDLIKNGVAPNVLFFEPFENVFQHAFATPTTTDSGLFAMRLLHWFYSKDDQLIPAARWLFTFLPDWLRLYFEQVGPKPMLELAISDCGLGIPNTLASAFALDADYHQKMGLPSWDSLQPEDRAWEIIRYAFDEHSSGRTATLLPGHRGLSWVKRTIEDKGGFVQVVSNGVSYSYWVVGGQKSEARHLLSTEPGFRLPGTHFRIVIPLDHRNVISDFPRTPAWRPRQDVRELFDEPQPNVTVVPLDPALRGSVPSQADCESFFHTLQTLADANPNSLIALDCEQASLSRIGLEYLCGGVRANRTLHGKLIVINCDRSVVCRLPTVMEVNQLHELDLILPFFDTSLRLFWAGATVQEEAELVKCFRGQALGAELQRFAVRNAGYFNNSTGRTIRFRFDIEAVETAVRLTLGTRLMEALKRLQALHRGRFVLPQSGKTVSTYIEPHKLFGDPALAARVCNHIATLLRWRYRPLTPQGPKKLRVLTATRIGRDITARMPAAYPRSSFVYYDYHIVRPGKPRLVKHLAGQSVVIVVDIVTTGGQVSELIAASEHAQAKVLGVVSIVDFSPGDRTTTRLFRLQDGTPVEHRTFWREPQTLSVSHEKDTLVDAHTLSLSPPVGVSALDSQFAASGSESLHRPKIP